MIRRPRIALIHALEESVLPARTAFENGWRDCDTFDLLDTSLATDLAARDGVLDEAMTARFIALARYAAATPGNGARTDALLFTCSAFGDAIDAVKQDLPVPVLRPNEAAFDAALGAGRRIGLLVTFAPSAASLSAELVAMAGQRGRDIAVTTAIADGALAALKAGDGTRHDELAAATAASDLAGCDVVVLGQFSLARAATAVEAATGRPVITTPAAAVTALRSRFPDPVERGA